MAGAMWRTLGAFSVPSICFEEARLASWRKREGYKKLRSSPMPVAVDIKQLSQSLSHY